MDKGLLDVRIVKRDGRKKDQEMGKNVDGEMIDRCTNDRWTNPIQNNK